MILFLNPPNLIWIMSNLFLYMTMMSDLVFEPSELDLDYVESFFVYDYETI